MLLNKFQKEYGVEIMWNLCILQRPYLKKVQHPKNIDTYMEFPKKGEEQ